MAVPFILRSLLGSVARARSGRVARGIGRGLTLGSRGIGLGLALGSLGGDRGLGSQGGWAGVEIDLSFEDNLNEVLRQISDFERGQLPFAISKALNDTASTLRKELEGELDSVFDRPTPWIRRSPFMEPSTKSSLAAMVGIRDQGLRVTPAHYLQEHFEGGTRDNKPMEKAMRAAGILPAGWLVVPGDGVKKDGHGNVSKATIARVIRELKGGGRRQTKAGTFRLFVVKPGETNRRLRHLAPGIWSTSKVGDQTNITPVFLFVSRASYRKTLDLPQLGRKVVARDFGRNFNAAFARALRTAR